MSQDQFDDYIRQQLVDHSTVLDAESIWQSIQVQQKPRRGIVWWVAGCVLVGLGWAAYVLAAGEAQKNNTQPADAHLLEALTKQPAATAQLPVAAPRQIDATLSSPMTIAATKFNSVRQLSAAKLPAPAVVAGSSTLTNGPAISAVSVADNPAEAVLQQPATAIVPTHAGIFPSDEAMSELNVLADETAVQPYDNRYPSNELQAESSLPKTASMATSLQETALEQEASPGEHLYRKKPSGWFVGIGGSTYNPLRSLSSSDPESELLAEAVRRTEKPLEVIGVELQAGRYLRPGWRVQAGIAAHQQTERFEWTFEQLIVDTVIGVQSIIIDANGDSTIITGPIARYQQLSRFKRTFNRYTFIDIPLLTGYEFGEGALKFSISGGAVINLLMQATGDRLSAQEQPVALAEATAFRMRAGLSFQAGMGCSWELHPRWHLHGQLAMRYFPWTITEDDSQLSQQYQWLGAQLGLRFLL